MKKSIYIIIGLAVLLGAWLIPVWFNPDTQDHVLAEINPTDPLHKPVVSTDAFQPAAAVLSDDRKEDTASIPSASSRNAMEGSRRYKVFDAVRSEDISWEKDTPSAHRACSVYPDPTLLTSVPVLKIGDHLELALFEDVVLEAAITDVTRYPSDAVGLTARLEGDGDGILYLTYAGDQLRVYADIIGGNDFYVFFDSSSQQHLALEVDRAASNLLECDTCSEVSQMEDMASVPTYNDATAASPSSSAAPVMIDVMVVYTPGAKAVEGGVNGIINNIAMAMQKSNSVHDHSGTHVTLNLVHLAEVAYTESGDAGTDLERLTYTGGTNSAMDEVQVWRDSYGADMVCLYADIDYAGGIAWMLNSALGVPDSAFSMVRVQQSDWTYTVAHEWGHNMGCGHSKTQSFQPGPGLYSYSAGWQWSDSASSASIGFCSVMTYENFDGTGGAEYEEVPYFSNPDLDYIGNMTNTMGHPVHGDNAQTIRNVRQVVSDYRANTTLLDSDDDGLPDIWETLYFGNSTGADPTDDLDGDGAENLAEYIAGTLPNDADSVFRITSWSIGPSGPPVILNWNSVPKRLYSVGYSTSPESTSLVPIAVDIPPTQNSYTDTVERVPSSIFYRLEVQLDPES